VFFYFFLFGSATRLLGVGACQCEAHISLFATNILMMTHHESTRFVYTADWRGRRRDPAAFLVFFVFFVFWVFCFFVLFGGVAYRTQLVSGECMLLSACNCR
jgi:hypothetical protein